ncbi:IkappaB kinase complex, IKAP component [Sanghuangporus baumii]|uniref:IkappaB kinase complex, IKAP component n=1 Tax=Sanghuangporus baumii TaxID=108892 RepID=A0A9Q5MZE3_SANBA|nr:IkappaB kinase complex, IKAP component [Sanghuangporus baumii]
MAPTLQPKINDMSAPHTARRSARLANRTSASSHEPSSSGQKAGPSSRRVKPPMKSRPQGEEVDWVCTPPPRFAFKERFRKYKGKKKAIEAPLTDLRPPSEPVTDSAEDHELLKEVQRRQAAMIEYLDGMLEDHQKLLVHLPPKEEFNGLLAWFSDVEDRVSARDKENERLRIENKRLHREMDKLKEEFRRLKEAVEEIRRKVEGLPPKYRRKFDPHGKPFREWRRSPLSAEIIPGPLDTTLAERRGRWHASPVLVESESSAEGSTDATLVEQDVTRKRRREEEDEPLREETMAGDAKPRPYPPVGGKSTWFTGAQGDLSAPPAKKRRVVAAAYDVEHSCAYALSEKQDEIEVFRIDTLDPSEEFPVPIATFAANGGVVSASYVSEAQAIAIITRGGDIGLVHVTDGSSNHSEVIGSVDSGIVSVGWSPDESLVVIINGDEKLLLMTKTFDVLLEQPLLTEESGESQQVNVGWGSKQTQFHGSLGKAAAQASPTSFASVGTSPDDDGLSRVSWRGDAAFFVVSTLRAPTTGFNERKRRTLRVYDRQGVLQNVAEPIAGLEHVLDWRPSGNLVASTQRFGPDGCGAGREGRHDVVFFERNGLRHGDFTLREQGNYKVRELFWNADSEILGVWIEREEGDVVQLWTTGNYHWYLKQEILAPRESNTPVKFTFVTWHPENAFHLLLTTQNQILEYALAWETLISRRAPPNDTGCVVVIDGTSPLITPFRTENVPPPMASYTLELYEAQTPIHVAFSPIGDYLAVLQHSGMVTLWNLRTRIGFSRGKAVDPVQLCMVELDLDGCLPRQIVLHEKPSASETFRVSCLVSNGNEDAALIAIVEENVLRASKLIDLPGTDGRFAYSETGLYWQSSEGTIFSVSASDGSPAYITSFPTFCITTEVVSFDDGTELFVGRSDSGKLYCTGLEAESAFLFAQNTTSMTVSVGFVIYTTSTHDAFFASLGKLKALILDSGPSGTSEVAAAKDQTQWERRRVERGSRIVTAVPSNMSLVLQMPRGNLETINPRPMVMTVVEQDIEAKSYRKAFLACRKHRIDLTILVQHDPATFLENISSFVDQIDDVDHLNLFLTNIGQSSLEPAKISEYCDALRAELESRSLTKYVNSILTAYVVKKPADYEAGLSSLLRLREINSELVEEAVKYIIFLVDADKLFDMALGMYDFSLVLLIAQHSQRDPREYLPFLRELRALPNYYQRHKIDDHLKRYSSALENLHLAGPEYFEEAVVFIEKHRLYREALSLWKNDVDHYKRILDVYGDYLYERREYRQAALVFTEAENSSKALVACERALMWREALELAIRECVDEIAFADLTHRLADELLSKKRYEEAARVFLDHAKSVRQCVSALAQGNMFSEARRIISLHREPSLLEEIVQPATLDTCTRITEDLDEMRTQLRKQLERIRELRIKKTEEPDAFYGLDDDPTLHSVDVMTDVSMAPTAFTRYTAAPSTASKASKRTSRSKRKMERKVGSGRKGTIDEEEYLLKSLGKLVGRFGEIQSDSEQVLPHLLQFSPEHRNEARELQVKISSFQVELQEAVDDVWPTNDTGDGASEMNVTSWAERMEERRRERENAIKTIAKPVLEYNESSWRSDIFGV